LDGWNTAVPDGRIPDRRGTNTKAELAKYLEAVFATLSTTLGKTHTESYILVHEVPAASYGFGGKTQEFRFISGRLKQAA
jgi:4-oxalocrotonate tautomerase